MKNDDAVCAVSGLVAGVLCVVFASIGYRVESYDPAPIPVVEWMNYWVVRANMPLCWLTSLL